MRVLVIHPEDELQDGPWGSQRWDRVIDLGKAGAESYAHVAASFGCAVTPLDAFRDNFKEKYRVRELLALGNGRLDDRSGLDWWELTSILVHQQLEIAFLLQQLVETLSPGDEVQVSRPCFHAEVLRLMLGDRVHTFSWQDDRHKRGARHYLRVMKKFPVGQLLEIFWDKTDPGYQFRGSLGSRRKPSSHPVVLLPSAYVNVSRTAIAYAQSLPESRFLLVATRRSGWIEYPPPNVSLTWLRQYASVRVPAREPERKDLVGRWDRLRSELKAVPEFRILAELGCLDDFPGRFAVGLEIRDAWRNVLDSEPVQSVLCADDSNPYTHIPLLLAAQKGLPTISCHHGALDGRYMFKRNHADVLLAKGKMEEDYLVRLCGIPPETVEVGAPILPGEAMEKPRADKRPSIVFFSEAYEVAGGRARGFYRDVLPALADLAVSGGRELVIKLHPAESLAERGGIIEQILSPEQHRVVRVVGGPLESEMLDKAWFGVTVMSTVAVECTLRGVPCFLCSWLEAWPYGYVDQFTRYGVGIRLNEPGEIRQIPVTLENYKAGGAARENCWSPIETRRLQTLLGISQRSTATAVRNWNSAKDSR
jgi:hypothetical protein